MDNSDGKNLILIYLTLEMIMDTSLLDTGTENTESTGKSATERPSEEQRMRW